MNIEKIWTEAVIALADKDYDLRGAFSMADEIVKAYDDRFGESSRSFDNLPEFTDLVDGCSFEDGELKIEKDYLVFNSPSRGTLSFYMPISEDWYSRNGGEFFEEIKEVFDHTL